MSEVLLSYRGRAIRAEDVAFLRALLAQNPGLSRRQLSVKVCQAWQWVQPNGQPRDMVCRSLMLTLHRRGLIQLPAQRAAPPNNAITHRPRPPVAEQDTTPMAGTLASLGPVEIRLVRRAEGEALFDSLLSQHHYLGYRRPVGEHLKYLVLAGARPLACLGWSSAPRQLRWREQLGAERLPACPLPAIAYNTRSLILPWVRVPQLASHILGRITRRISADWQALYEHPLELLESFVDTERFQGTCYRAANWICLGRSAGRGTKSQHGQPACSLKEYWVYPLSWELRLQLGSHPTGPSPSGRHD